jgi:hypothetical protein
VSANEGENNIEQLAKYFPSFMWVVRDFALKLQDTQNNTISSKDYFENSLQPQKGSSDIVESRNRIRRLIKHFFTDRDCFTMVRPTEQETDLQNLQCIDSKHMRPEFVQ